MINKTLITLQGVGNSGKTSTLKRLLKLLLEDEKFVQYETFDSNTQKRIEVQTDAGKYIIKKRGDIKITVITLKTDSDMVIKIGIATAGDSEDIVKKNIKKLSDLADIIVCTARYRGRTADELCNHVKEYPQMRYLPFYKNSLRNESEYSDLDLRLAKDMYYIINLIIKQIG